VTRLLALVLAAGFEAGCEADPLPSRSAIDGLRVLAVRAEPPEMRPDQATTLTALVAPDRGLREGGFFGGAIGAAWTACVDPPGGDPLRCIGREDAFMLDPGSETTCPVPGFPCATLTLPAETRPLDAVVGVVLHACAGNIDADAVPPFCEGTGAEAVTRVWISEAPVNGNPVVAAIRFGDVEVPAELLGISIPACEAACPRFAVSVLPTDGSDETVVDADGARREVLFVAFAADAGTFDVAFDAEEPFEAGFAPPSGEADTRVWVVLHDDRGGVDFREFLVRTR